MKTLSPWKRDLKFLKTVFTVFIVFKWLGGMFVWWFDNVRRATVMQAMDKYPESKVWKTILWIKTWRYIYGIIIGLILAWYLEADVWVVNKITYIQELIQELIKLL